MPEACIGCAHRDKWALVVSESSLRLVLALACAILGAALWPRSAHAKEAATTPDPMMLEVPGYSDAYYFKPRTKSRRPIMLYLHGRGGNAFEDCRKWARVGRQFGWVVCPQGPAPTDSGGRSWNNDPETAEKIIHATVVALQDKYPGRVRSRGDVLIGFSEGAFIAQQVGVRDPLHWNRWLILAANDHYWLGDAPQLLEQNRSKIRRVYLFTGEEDQVAENTKRAAEMLKDARIRVRMKIEPGLGHEVPADRMITNYRRPLRWLLAAK
jgi:predicted esterase